MTQFFVGDRVRVRKLPVTVTDAGRIGTVVGVKRDGATGVVVLCQVHLDGDSGGEVGEVGVPFLADELEPE